MAGVNDMLKAARRDLGMRGRPNRITRKYAARGHGSYFLRAPWCNMAVTVWALESGNYNAVCFGTDYAYTVWHAQRFQKAGRWYTGTSANVRKARPGDIVFFDWGGTNSVGAIDHIGIVEKNLGDGRLQCIEGNTGNACLRKIRTASTIAGYGRPNYSGVPDKPYKWNGKAPSGSSLLRNGSFGDNVRSLQNSLNLVYGANLAVDGEFGPKTANALKHHQRSWKIEVDGVYGNDSARTLQGALDGKKPGSGPITPPPAPSKPKYSGAIPNGKPYIRMGHKGTRVRNMQRALVAAGHRLPRYGSDGDFGSETRSALMGFQRAAGIEVDGVYGPETRKALVRKLK